LTLVRKRDSQNTISVFVPTRRDVIAAAAIALLAGVAVALPAFDILRGLSLDALTALRWRAFGQQSDPNSSPIVIVAMDEESFHTPPFEGTPTIAWTREVGRVLTAIIDGGAKVVGFDVVFATSIEQSSIPVGEETLGNRLRGFDRDFLRALALAARDGKVVLGEIQHRDEPILPAAGQRVAVGQQRNIRALNVYDDPDEVVRRIPLSFMVDGARMPSMTVELAARALGSPPEFGSDGSLTIAGRRIESAIPNTMTLNFAGGDGDIPTFSLADLSACAAKGDQEFFQREFKDKIVLIGSLLDVEDRKLTSARFATGPEHVRGARCALPKPRLAATFVTGTIPGAYVHATAINNLMRHNEVREVGHLGVAIVATAFSALIALAVLMLAPIGAVAVYVVTALAWGAATTAMFNQGVALPLVQPAVAGLFALAATIGYRFAVADRDKRLLRKSFALYLAPAVIEKMLASNRPPALGGETRTITAFFTDVAGFSKLSENRTPSEIVALMNEYLTAMTDIVEEHGGFVDKYVGDAIAAVFGAPLDDQTHASSGVRAALACRRRLDELNHADAAFGSCRLDHRIGLNSGDALVGNIGSRRRFNYTVMGDMVNVASRLEGANKYFGTSIIASEATVALTGAGFVWRELDIVRVQGRSQPVKIFEPLAEAGQASADDLARANAYAEGLARWRGRDFAGAVNCFERFAHLDPPSALFLIRAKAFAANPPRSDWTPVNTLEGK
jgi:class 3 adenylate cyclase/CHASE2 domain-containing sensor protein